MIKIILLSILFIWGFFCFQTFSAPSFGDIEKGNLWVYESDLWVNKKKPLINNIESLFFPDDQSWWWNIWNKLQMIFVGLLFIFLVWAGALFVLWSNDDWQLKQAKNNILYIFYGAFLVFGSTWILWNILNVWEDIDTSDTIINIQKELIWSVLIFFKSFAYYLAIILIVYHGYKIMQAQEKDDKVKAWRNWVLNVILALIAIKVLDYIYYIAQSSDFTSKWKEFIWSIWIVLGWILWVVVVIVLIYAGLLLITSRGNEESMKKSKTIIRNVFLVLFVLFLFIVIVYDLVKNLT